MAYLTTQYPAVSHTFIRRELRELEARGHYVLRLSIRPAPAELVDPLDREEAHRTLDCLGKPRVHLLAVTLGALLRDPIRFARAITLAARMGTRSERGALRHLAYLAEACYFLAILQRERIEHVHVHFGTNSATVARLIRHLGGPSYSLTVHGPDEFDTPLGFDLRGKVHDAAFVAAISRYCAAQLYRWSDAGDWPRIDVIRCTVDGEYAVTPRPIAADCCTLISIGRLNAQKGQILLLEAVRRLRDAGVDLQLVLVGDGELRSFLEDRIDAWHLRDCVQITGYVSNAEVHRYLGRSRALVLASFAEGLPVVIMEAFAAGRPVVATAIAGVPELVRDGENGWLVPAGDVCALADALRRVLETPSDRLAAMGLAGRERVLRDHNLQHEVDRLETQLLAARNGAS